MGITLASLIVWLIVGALAGSLAGRLVTWSKRGFGHLTNLGLGMVGALLGGVLFRLFHIDLGLEQIQVSAKDLVSALLGSLLLLAILWLVRRLRRGKPPVAPGPRPS